VCVDKTTENGSSESDCHGIVGKRQGNQSVVLTHAVWDITEFILQEQ
jgi:hypothetical protein